MKLRTLSYCAFLLLRLSAVAQTVSVIEGNVFISAGTGGTKQLTSSGGDSDPALAPDGKTVAFVRALSERKVSTGSGDDNSEIWLMHSDGSHAERIVVPRAAEKMQEVLGLLAAPQFSADGRRLFFETTAWATSGAVHVLDLATRKDRFVCSGNSLEVVRTGEYRDCLLVQQHRYFVGGGSYDWFWLLRPDGKEVGPVGDDTDMFHSTFSLEHKEARAKSP